MGHKLKMGIRLYHCVECQFAGCTFASLRKHDCSDYPPCEENTIIKRQKPVDLIRLGIVKRKLTREESKRITDEVLATGIKSPAGRFSLAIIKAMEITEKQPSGRRIKG